MTTVLIFLAVLFVLILVHEWGHFIVAKLTRMRVDEFAIGFPPRLFSRKYGETEYSLNALPLGGYVRIYGEDPTAVEGEVADKSRAFGSRPKWAQALVLLAGVTMNWIFAWFLLVVIMLVGVPTQITEKDATDNSVIYIESVLEGSPADTVLPPQSKLIRVESGDSVLNPILPSTFSEFVASRAGETIDITYQDVNGAENTVSVIPQTGVIESSPERAALGVSMSLVETVQKPLGTAIVDAGIQTWTMTKTIVVGFGKLITGQVSLNQISGPVGIAGYVGDAAAVGVTTLLYLTAFISVNLAVINLLPIPALDGGRLVFVAIEAVTRRPIPPVWASRVNLVGFAALMLLMLLATISDISKLF
ncbi:site-2 protease family protein [Patescibacteria group bacterium]|nr:site-2 protease family protein [Patescibacteria group bacterium]